MMTAMLSSASNLEDRIPEKPPREPSATESSIEDPTQDRAVTRIGADVSASDAEVRRHGVFVHELRNHLNTAMMAFHAVKSGRSSGTGSTAAMLERSLRGLREIIDRSVSELRIASGTYHRERLRVSDFIEEMATEASMDARNHGLQFSVEPVNSRLFLDVDRHLFASAISNLLQNALKFTRPSSRVWLRTRATADRVSIEVEDECGGLPPGAVEAIFRPFEQWGSDRSGLGLGLTISRKAIEASGGTLSVRDVPGKGCVFTVEMPLAIGGLAVTGRRSPSEETPPAAH